LNGAIFLILSIVADPLKFAVNTYTKPYFDEFEEEANMDISRDAFNLFEEVCDDIENMGEASETNLIDYAQFNKKL